MRSARLSLISYLIERAPHLVSVPHREVGLLCEACGTLARAQVTRRRFPRMCEDCGDQARPHRAYDHYDDLGGEA